MGGGAVRRDDQVDPLTVEVGTTFVPGLDPFNLDDASELQILRTCALTLQNLRYRLGCSDTM
jgi:hypothetical protein